MMQFWNISLILFKNSHSGHPIHWLNIWWLQIRLCKAKVRGQKLPLVSYLCEVGTTNTYSKEALRTQMTTEIKYIWMLDGGELFIVIFQKLMWIPEVKKSEANMKRDEIK